MQGGLVELGKRRPVKRLAAIAREGVPGHLIDRVLREVVNDARKRDRPAPFQNRRRALRDAEVRLGHGRRLGQRRRGAVQLRVDVPRHKLPVMKALVRKVLRIGKLPKLVSGADFRAKNVGKLVAVKISTKRIG